MKLSMRSAAVGFMFGGGTFTPPLAAGVTGGMSLCSEASGGERGWHRLRVMLQTHGSEALGQHT